MRTVLTRCLPNLQLLNMLSTCTERSSSHSSLYAPFQLRSSLHQQSRPATDHMFSCPEIVSVCRGVRILSVLSCPHVSRSLARFRLFCCAGLSCHVSVALCIQNQCKFLIVLVRRAASERVRMKSCKTLSIKRHAGLRCCSRRYTCRVEERRIDQWL